jgi:cytochrome c
MNFCGQISVLFLMSVLTSAPAIAAEPDGEALLAEKRCVACHDVSKNLLGPSYEAIAARHAAQKDTMVEVLAQKIIAGGAGNWGVVPMVPNEHVSLDEARAMSRWILSQ